MLLHEVEPGHQVAEVAPSTPQARAALVNMRRAQQSEANALTMQVLCVFMMCILNSETRVPADPVGRSCQSIRGGRGIGNLLESPDMSLRVHKGSDHTVSRLNDTENPHELLFSGIGMCVHACAYLCV